jgi:hypothetical protein
MSSHFSPDALFFCCKCEEEFYLLINNGCCPICYHLPYDEYRIPSKCASCVWKEPKPNNNVRQSSSGAASNTGYRSSRAGGKVAVFKKESSHYVTPKNKDQDSVVITCCKCEAMTIPSLSEVCSLCAHPPCTLCQFEKTH